MDQGLDFDAVAPRTKPARLYWDADRSTWAILDAGKRHRLGIPQGEAGRAEAALEKYILTKRSKEKPAKGRRADQVSVDEVLDRYLERKAAKVARPGELGQRVEALAAYWSGMTLDEVDEDTCGAFVDDLGSESYGRRCLEDLRAAINAYARAGYLRDLVRLTLPDKSRSRTDWLTHEEAIALCKVAWRERDAQVRDTREGKRLVETTRRRWRHLVPFVATAIATCSRSARIYEASYVAEPGRPYVDLRRGIYHRSWQGEVVAGNKRAPTVPVPDRLLRAMRHWSADKVRRGRVVPGDRYVVQYANRAADPKKAFSQCVEAAREAFPTLFRRDDGTPKVIVRHSLRHTGITWYALEGVDPYEICKFAGLSMEVFERVYSHHHPDFMSGIRKAKGRSKPKAKQPENEREDA